MLEYSCPSPVYMASAHFCMATARLLFEKPTKKHVVDLPCRTPMHYEVLFEFTILSYVSSCHVIS
jgi:hypothetical protein